jgi:signal transduction protein with GAF and PtsI domain
MTPEPHDPLLAEIDALRAGAGDPPWDRALDRVLARVDCPVGTIHRWDPASRELRLEAQRGLPPPVAEKVQRVPIGKGMAGIAAERRAPVQVCNLQSDDSGVVRPGAKLTFMEGSIACPMLSGDQLCGVLGVAKPVPYEFTADEVELLLAVGTRLARVSGAG